MNHRNVLIGLLDDLENNNENSDELLDVLIKAAVLLSEVNSKRFRASSYKRVIKLDRVKITMEFGKYANSN